MVAIHLGVRVEAFEEGGAEVADLGVGRGSLVVTGVDSVVPVKAVDFVHEADVESGGVAR